ncbi:MAG: hypothetical protein FJY67_03865 [Calditrichaeota bacterium]|nr:hypothetical protein [Calditrichota bacterium]
MRYLFIILTLAACAPAPQTNSLRGDAGTPEWVHSRRYREYSSDFGFVGIGSGATRESAVDAAIADIARQIEVHIEADLHNVQTSRLSRESEELTGQFESAIRSAAKATLSGVEVFRTAESGGVHYAFGYLDRERHTANLARDIRSRRAALDQSVQFADSLAGRGLLIEALGILNESLPAEIDVEAQERLYFSLKGAELPHSLERPGLNQILMQTVRALSTGLQIERISGDGQEVERGRLLPEPVVVRVTATYKAPGSPMPVPGMPLELIRHDGEVIDQNKTDVEGLARLNGIVVGSGESVLRVEPVLKVNRSSPLLKNLPTTLQSKGVGFTYRVGKVTPQKVAVLVRSEIGQDLPAVRSKIVRAITDAGHTVSDGGGLMARAEVREIESREIVGVQGRQHLVRIELSLVLETQPELRQLASLKATSQGLSPVSRADAFADACNKLTLSPDQIAGLIASINNKR